MEEGCLQSHSQSVAQLEPGLCMFSLAFFFFFAESRCLLKVDLWKGFQSKTEKWMA